MSSLSTLPKGDSAWLLRKSIQRIMQQVSVLETNIGSSTTGNSADTQVIFNDAGTLRGDTGLTYDKSADRLSFGAGICYGLLTSASATITGDLTVRTTGLTVNSSGVGVGVTAALGAGNIQIGAGKYLGYSATAYITPEDNVQGARVKADNILIDGNTSTKFNIAGSEAMRLNSTGLGVGASPAQKLTVAGSAEITGGVVGQGALIGRDGSSGGANYGANTGNTSLNAPAGGSVRFNVNNGTFAGVFDANANLGIGVTPSATWASNRRALQIGGLASGAVALNGTSGSGEIFFNSFFNSSTQNICVVTGGTGKYDFNVSTVGAHSWSVGTGTAGNAFTFTQAMTLTDAGDLLVGTTSSPSGTKVGAIAKLSGVSAEGTAAINVSTTPVAISRNTGVCGLFFVMGYNASGGAQGWYLVASTGSGTPTVISSGGTPGLTLTFTMAGGQLNAQTASGTFVVNAFSITA